MNKVAFISKLNEFHAKGERSNAVKFLGLTTKLSLNTCVDIIKIAWDASKEGSYGKNLFDYLESTANETISSGFNPVLKKGYFIYIKYLDNHAAAFALYKIKKYKNKVDGESN